MSEQERFSATGGRDLLYVAATIVVDQQVVGVARVSGPLAAINASLTGIALFVGAALIVTAAIAVGLAIWIAGTVTRPLRQLTTAADLLARGSLRTTVAVEDRGEVGILAASFNRMARQLEQQVASLARERDVFANVLTNMADGIIVVDQQGTVLVANGAARRLLDVTEAPEGVSLARAVRDHEICAALQRRSRTGHAGLRCGGPGGRPAACASRRRRCARAAACSSCAT